MGNAKTAATYRADCAAQLLAMFDKGGIVHTCAASMTHDEDMMTAAYRMAWDGIGAGFVFGNSNSNNNPTHVMNLFLSSAEQLWYARYVQQRAPVTA